ncbi:hypothetical protein C8R44DRAFT_929435 [Mycena epipterygia]|nr:hypothetical protein C8R44DRAFT_929435 [Mycena epipterygia]
MHRCLEIPEVIRMIFGHLAGEPSDTTALGRLAITCLAFMDPALDTLWCNQVRLEPLLYFLPGIWDPPNEDPCFGRHRLFLRLSLTTCDEHSLDLFELLANSFPFDLLLPNLQNLAWISYNHRSLPYIRLFLGPKISSIDLELDESTSCLSILPLLASKYPSLAHVKISPRTHFAASTLRATSSLIRGLTAVQTVSVECMDAAACQHLAALPTVTSLAMKIHELVYPAYYPLPSQRIFPALRTLKITAPGIDISTNFIGVLSTPPLNTLKVNVLDPATADRGTALFSAIHKGCSHSLLTGLEVHLGRYRDDLEHPSAYTFSPTQLQPLLAFTRLSKVVVRVPFRLRLDDAFVAEMATAWPQIEELSLSRPTLIDESSPSSRATIPGLLAFARHCPVLHTLRLPLSGNFLSPWGKEESRGRRPEERQQALSTLDVLDSPLADAVRVASFLSAAFPCLSTIEAVHQPRMWLEEDFDDDHWQAVESSVSLRWNEVERLVPLFADLREQEEAHWRRKLGGNVHHGPALA